MRRYISLPYAPSYLTSLRVLTLSIPRLFLSLSLFLGYTSRFQRRAYAPINVPRSHTHTHTHEIYACACAFVCVCVCVYTRVRSWLRAANTLRSPRLRGRASGGAHQLPSYNKRRKKRGKNLLSLRQVYTARSVPRPAAVGSCALYRYLFVPFIPASSLSLFPRFSLGCPFPFCPVAPRSFLPPPPASVFLFFFSITVGVARQPVHRGQANFLPAVILFRPSRSLRPGLTRPLRQSPRTSTNSSSSYPPAVIYLFPRCPSLPLPFLRSRILLAAVRHCSSSSREAFPQASYCYYFRGYRTYPFLPAMMQRFINFRDANRR